MKGGRDRFFNSAVSGSPAKSFRTNALESSLGNENLAVDYERLV